MYIVSKICLTTKNKLDYRFFYYYFFNISSFHALLHAETAYITWHHH
jgi:hypothetical protein